MLADARLLGFFPGASVLLPSRRTLLLCLFCACVTTGALVAEAALPNPPSSPAWLTQAQQEGKMPRVRGLVTHIQGLPDSRLRIVLSGLHPVEGGPPLQSLTVLTWEKPALRPLPGQTLEGSFRIYNIQGFVNPGASDSSIRWRLRGIFQRAGLRGNSGDVQLTGEPSAGARLHEAFRAKLVTALNPENKDELTRAEGILPALLFGDRFFMDTSFMQQLSATNLIHSLALSGQHLAVAGFFAFLLVSLAGRMAPGIFLRLPRRKLLLLAALPFAALYLWLGDAPPSLLRAAIMAGVFAFLLLRDRVCTLVDALVGAVVCISLLSPTAVHDLGLQLSVASVGAMALCFPVLERLRLPAGKGFRASVKRRGAQILAVSLTVQIVLLPLLVSFFGNAGPWFFLNIFWLPVLDCIVMPLAVLGAVLTALDLPAAAHLVFQPALILCAALPAGLDLLDKAGLLELPALLRPHWTTLFAYAALMPAIALCARDARPTRTKIFLAGAAALLLCIGPGLRALEAADTDLRLRLMDVAHGQAVLLETPQGRRALIDGGSLFSPRFDVGRDLLAPALSANHAPDLAWIVNSHPDRDHLHGLFYLIGHFRVGSFTSNGDSNHKAAERLAALLKKRGLAHNTLISGQALDMGPDLRLETLHPPSGYKGSSNNKSLVLRLMWKGKPLALIPGDAEQAALKRLTASGADLRAPVLILPHHGGISSFSPEFYDAVGARLALASNGPSPRYPAPEVRAALAARGMRLLETDKHGQILLRWDAQGNFSVEQARKISEP